MYIRDLHSSCILFSPPTRLSQQASMDPSGVGQHSPSMPIAAQPREQSSVVGRVQGEERVKGGGIREDEVMCRFDWEGRLCIGE